MILEFFFGLYVLANIMIPIIILGAIVWFLWEFAGFIFKLLGIGLLFIILLFFFVSLLL